MKKVYEYEKSIWKIVKSNIKLYTKDYKLTESKKELNKVGKENEFS